MAQWSFFKLITDYIVLILHKTSYIFNIPYACAQLLFKASKYGFDVVFVDKCPVSKEEWNTRSNQLKCNETNGYQCVPNEHRTSLIEFCYPKGVRIPFEPGN